MWLMLKQKKPDDYVIATGKSRSVKEFVNESFKCIKINIICYQKVSSSNRRHSSSIMRFSGTKVWCQ